jgi:hypothetical protein
MSEEDVNRITESYAWSPRKSLSRGNRELNIPQTTLWRVLRKRLVMKAFKLQVIIRWYMNMFHVVVELFS